jgi:hypothetical protein
MLFHSFSAIVEDNLGARKKSKKMAAREKRSRRPTFAPPSSRLVANPTISAMNYPRFSASSCSILSGCRLPPVRIQDETGKASKMLTESIVVPAT